MHHNDSHDNTERKAKAGVPRPSSHIMYLRHNELTLGELNTTCVEDKEENQRLMA
jgi:hypothetical protein